jgi:ADP-ribose pyrophosphatase
MTSAKFKLVVVKVELEDKMEYPVPHPDPGEHIVVKVVELARLKLELEGAFSLFSRSMWAHA